MTLVDSGRSNFSKRARRKGHKVLNLSQARKKDVRTLHVGLLNLMPDAVFRHTEEQFMFPIHVSSAALQVRPHFFTLPSIERSPKYQKYIEQSYETFDEIQAQGLDALIVTGAQCPHTDLSKAVFWDELGDVHDWADEHVTSTWSACMGFHFRMQHGYGEQRTRLDEKKWGMFKDSPTYANHPLTRNMGRNIWAIHSRENEISAEQVERAGLRTLISGRGGVSLAVSPDGLKEVLCQYHPEYSPISLAKEWKRDFLLNLESNDVSNRIILPDGTLRFPENYLDTAGRELMYKFAEEAEDVHTKNKRRKNRLTTPSLDEDRVLQHVDDVWIAQRTVLFSNWLKAVYDKTNYRRNSQFMKGVDESNVFGFDYDDPELKSAPQVA